MKETLTLEFDGGSRGNPGPAAIGVVVRAADGTPLVTLGRPIGRATNNVAEYRALITAMEKALELGAASVIIRGDSELIIKQMRGEYRVKHPDLRPLHEQAQQLYRKFQSAKLEHNRRHHNHLADKLANLAMDRKRDVEDADDFAGGPGSSATDLPKTSSASTADSKSASATRYNCSDCACEIVVRKPSSLPPGKLNHFTCQCGAMMKPLE